MTTLTRHALGEEAKRLGLTPAKRRVVGRKGTNFMTPELVGLYEKGPYDIEIALGEFLGDKLAGFTVWRGTTNEYDLSGAIWSVDELAGKVEALA